MQAAQTASNAEIKKSQNDIVQGRLKQAELQIELESTRSELESAKSDFEREKAKTARLAL